MTILVTAAFCVLYLLANALLVYPYIQDLFFLNTNFHYKHTKTYIRIKEKPDYKNLENLHNKGTTSFIIFYILALPFYTALLVLIFFILFFILFFTLTTLGTSPNDSNASFQVFVSFSFFTAFISYLLLLLMIFFTKLKVKRPLTISALSSCLVVSIFTILIVSVSNLPPTGNTNLQDSNPASQSEPTAPSQFMRHTYCQSPNLDYNSQQACTETAAFCSHASTLPSSEREKPVFNRNSLKRETTNYYQRCKTEGW